MIRRWFRRLFVALLPVVKVAPLPEDQTQAALIRGRHAESLLQDEVLSEAFSEIENRLMAEWRDSASLSHEKREVLFHQVAAIQSVRGQLKRWSEDAIYLASRIEKAGR